MAQFPCGLFSKHHSNEFGIHQDAFHDHVPPCRLAQDATETQFEVRDTVARTSSHAKPTPLRAHPLPEAAATAARAPMANEAQRAPSERQSANSAGTTGHLVQIPLQCPGSAAATAFSTDDVRVALQVVPDE